MILTDVSVEQDANASWVHILELRQIIDLAVDDYPLQG